MCNSGRHLIRVGIPARDVFFPIAQIHAKVVEYDSAPTERTRNRLEFTIRIQDEPIIRRNPEIPRIRSHPNIWQVKNYIARVTWVEQYFCPSRNDSRRRLLGTSQNTPA
jgi:hypothetical protein